MAVSSQVKRAAVASRSPQLGSRVYNVELARSRRRIMRVCTATQYVVAGILFIVEFVVGVWK
jgi:hypothetical protein